MKINKKYIGDLVIITAILALCIVLGVAIYSTSTNTNSVNITLDGNVCKTLPLTKDAEFSPDGGSTVVTICDGRAYISKSDCHDGLCMDMKPVTKDGGSVICLPNRVTITRADQNTSGGTDYVAG